MKKKSDFTIHIAKRREHNTSFLWGKEPIQAFFSCCQATRLKKEITQTWNCCTNFCLQCTPLRPTPLAQTLAIINCPKYWLMNIDFLPWLYIWIQLFWNSICHNHHFPQVLNRNPEPELYKVVARKTSLGQDRDKAGLGKLMATWVKKNKKNQPINFFSRFFLEGNKNDGVLFLRVQRQI